MFPVRQRSATGAWRWAVLWLLLALWPLVVLAGPQEPQNLAVLVDAAGQETIATVSAPQAEGRFTPLRHSLQAGCTRHVHWLRFTLPASAATAWWLEVRPSFLDDLRLYEEVGGRYVEHRGGDTVPRGSRDVDARNGVFKLQPSGARPRMLYLRLQTTSSSIAKLALWQPDDFLAEAQWQTMVTGLYLGTVLMLVLFSLGLWLQLRERLFALFSLHALAHAVHHACSTGWAAQYLPPGLPGLADVAVTLAAALLMSTSVQVLWRLTAPPPSGPRLRALQGLTALPWLLPAAHLSGCLTEVAPAVVALYAVLQPCLLWLSMRQQWNSRQGMPLLPMTIICLNVLPTTLGVLTLIGGANIQLDTQLLHLTSSLLTLGLMLAAMLLRLRELYRSRQQTELAARIANQHSAQAEQLFQVEQAGRQALQGLLIERDAALAQLQQAQWLGKIGDWAWVPGSRSLEGSDVVRHVLEGPPTQQDRPVRLKDLQNRLGKPARQDRHAAVRQTWRSGAPFRLQLQLLLPSGQLRWLELHGMLVHGARPCLRGTLQDVSIRHLAQQAAALEHRKDLAMRAKSEFLARVSHEMRTPLNAVLGFTQLLALNRQVQALPVAAEQVSLIQGAAHHLQAMIDDVLDLASLQAGGLKLALGATPVAPLVESCMAWLGTLAQQHQVALHWAGTDTALLVQADHNRLRQVLLNLLRNAIQYNRPGGLVSVRVQRTAPDGAESGKAPPAATLALSVHDSGLGMTDAQIGALFTPFTRLADDPERTEGAGLGLTVSRSLVEAMGGALQVASVPGEGSIFTVLLPEAPGSPVASWQPLASNQPAGDAGDLRTTAVLAGMAAARGLGQGQALPVPHPLKSHTVLYIDDNRLNLAVVRHAMRRLPQVGLVLASNGADGLAQARALQPDLVLLDINLPGMDGLAVLQHLRQDPQLAHIPCVAVSANALPQDITTALDAGFRHYVTKPFQIQQLLDLVRSECGLAEAA
jgi:signal transduction histidine kinase/ActR/RegA family two-component response regulator